MAQNELNPERKWEISVKHLESQKLKLHLQFANGLIRKGPNENGHHGSSPLLKDPSQRVSPIQKENLLRNRRNPLSATNVVKPTTSPSNAKLSKQLMLLQINRQKNSC